MLCFGTTGGLFRNRSLALYGLRVTACLSAEATGTSPQGTGIPDFSNAPLFVPKLLWGCIATLASYWLTPYRPPRGTRHPPQPLPPHPRFRSHHQTPVPKHFPEISPNLHHILPHLLSYNYGRTCRGLTQLSHRLIPERPARGTGRPASSRPRHPRFRRQCRPMSFQPPTFRVREGKGPRTFRNEQTNYHGPEPERGPRAARARFRFAQTVEFPRANSPNETTSRRPCRPVREKGGPPDACGRAASQFIWPRDPTTPAPVVRPRLPPVPAARAGGKRAPRSCIRRRHICSR